MNFDKRQVHSSLGKFGEFTGNGLVKVLIAPQLYPALDVAFKSIFMCGLLSSWSIERTTDRH